MSNFPCKWTVIDGSGWICTHCGKRCGTSHMASVFERCPLEPAPIIERTEKEKNDETGQVEKDTRRARGVGPW